jgi:LysR family hydrogen peroxide-inducible transcriptional activator
MELTQVRHFITLCSTFNFTRAAEQCGISQPAITRSIQRLEDEFGGPLLFRERSHSQLTELGRAMRPHLEAMLQAGDAARALAYAKLTGNTSSLKIGLGPGIGASSVADAVRKIAETLPDILIQFEEAAPASLAEAMLADRLDCALLPDSCHLSDRLNRWPLYSDRAVAVLPPGHKLLAQKTIGAQDIQDETILVGELCGGFATRLVKSTSYALRLQHCHGATSQIQDLVGAGIGIALLSDRVRIASPLRVRPFHEPEIIRHIVLSSVSGRPLNVAAASFIKLCRTQTFA